MAAIKAYTDISQSGTLSKILSPESADMWYDNDGESIAGRPEVRCGSFVGLASKNIPCWGLAALLSVIPNYKLSSEHNYHTCTAETSFGKETVGWFDNPIDACVEMIIKLHELNLL